MTPKKALYIDSDEGRRTLSMAIVNFGMNKDKIVANVAYKADTNHGLTAIEIAAHDKKPYDCVVVYVDQKDKHVEKQLETVASFAKLMAEKFPETKVAFLTDEKPEDLSAELEARGVNTEAGVFSQKISVGGFSAKTVYLDSVIKELVGEEGAARPRNGPKNSGAHPKRHP